MKEADKKVWIVPGKIRVASVFFALIVATVVTTAVVLGDVQRKDRAVQEHLAEEVLRFHVLANSDSRKDQAVKLEVRDAVLSYLKEVLPEGMDVKETTRWMREHTEEIRRVAQQKMTDLRIELGEAAGHNWWCVLYPNLCFLDTTNPVLPEKGKQQLKKVLTEEEYSEVTAGSKFQIRWFFWKEK